VNSAPATSASPAIIVAIRSCCAMVGRPCVHRSLTPRSAIVTLSATTTAITAAQRTGTVAS